VNNSIAYQSSIIISKKKAIFTDLGKTLALNLLISITFLTNSITTGVCLCTIHPRQI